MVGFAFVADSDPEADVVSVVAESCDLFSLPPQAAIIAMIENAMQRESSFFMRICLYCDYKRNITMHLERYFMS